MDTLYKYSGDVLGSFDFVGTKEDFEKMLEELKNNCSEFDGQIGTGSTLDTLKNQKYGIYRDCLTYQDEAIAIEIIAS